MIFYKPTLNVLRGSFNNSDFIVPAISSAAVVHFFPPTKNVS